jgi:hypothetical protein
VPKVFNHLKDLGIPLELIVAKPLQNMYANYFCTDIVMWLWDNIFLAA